MRKEIRNKHTPNPSQEGKKRNNSITSGKNIAAYSQDAPSSSLNLSLFTVVRIRVKDLEFRSEKSSKNPQKSLQKCQKSPLLRGDLGVCK